MENNFLSLIKTRRSVRAYKSDPVPSEALDAVLEAGTYAPTGGGHQSPTIIAITDPKYRQEIAKLNAEVELSRIVQSKKHPKFLIDYCAVCRLQSL